MFLLYSEKIEIWNIMMKPVEDVICHAYLRGSILYKVPNQLIDKTFFLKTSCYSGLQIQLKTNLTHVLRLFVTRFGKLICCLSFYKNLSSIVYQINDWTLKATKTWEWFATREFMSDSTTTWLCTLRML